MTQIIITISPDGQSKVEAKGVSGPGCKSLTRDVEQALGKTTGDEKKPEFHRQVTTTTKLEIRQ